MGEVEFDKLISTPPPPIPPITVATAMMDSRTAPAAPDDHLQEAGPSECIFETLHNNIKCALSIKESNFNEEIDQNFHICFR